MKTIIQHLFLPALVLLFMSGTAVSQERGSDKARVSPNASVAQTIGTTTVSITYGRPALKNRSYFSENAELAPAGKVWRTGANECTAITFSDDVILGDKKVKAGTYSLYTIPNNDTWTFILNKKLSWGTQYDENEDYVRVSTAAVDNNASDHEQFIIYFDGLSDKKAHLNLHWGTTKAAVPISIGSN